MKTDYLLMPILNSPVLSFLQGGGHFTIGKMEKSLTPIGWAVLFLLILFALFLVIKAIRFLLKSKKLK